ncbi:MAG: branched-chain amino acid ABC transporter permease [Deltaproteobacteria bacterium]|nr:branched-chain amino acid ABC transporter permease [Deltaproteobacteria bacterium]MBW1920169.1 branched-chain amino acid ABC transporter permease [Deltaproteobacteria bacterium]MBW1934667.1 branched-chain amino acid ABC transporter permease [Deltaproteobacteria bacterium]MBW1978285.1 branched-chain amino acid ABC transporter permease [Deltaproteobacteria bacterium]MBW2046155.1 branched-chain amino acid ABC transporter permease [Deltaproteobacteria bacterium]
MIVLLALAIFPWLGAPVYFVSLLFTVFMYVCLATSWNLIGGYAGYLSFGHVAFFGIGAYTTALLVKGFHLSALETILSSVPAGFVAMLVALLVGYPCLRLRGPYFAVVTLCFAFVMDLLIKNLNFLGGPEGLWLKSMDLPIQTVRAILFEAMLGVTALSIAVAYWTDRSKFGAGLRAIREDEEVAQTMAINAPKLKMQAFALSAFFPGMAGGIYAYYLTYIHTDVVFDMMISILIVLMALFGGGGTLLGPIIGAVLLTLINEGLSTFVKAELARIIYGSLFVGVIIFLPNGIMEFFRRTQGESPH